MDMTNQFGGYYGQQFANTGYQWNPNGMQQTKRMNVLTADEIQTLMKTENKFTLALTQTEKLKAACTHMRADGMDDTLVQNADGTLSCAICGYTFKPVDPATSGEDFLQASVENIVDIIQTIKMIWIDVDPQVLREYCQVLPLIEKLPELYNIAIKNFSNHENTNAWSYANRNMGTLQMFGLLSGVLNGAGTPNNVQFGYQGYQQPQYQQPMGAPTVGNMMPGGANPFGGYGNPAQFQAQAPGYNPSTAGFIYDPTNPAQMPPQQPVVDPAAQVQGTAPVAEQTTTDGSTTTTSATFKA